MAAGSRKLRNVGGRHVWVHLELVVLVALHGRAEARVMREWEQAPRIDGGS